MSALTGAMTAAAGGRALARREPAVILHAELRNFTRLSEILDRERVLALMSGFFSLAEGAVKAHGGDTFCLQNDSLVAAFRSGRAAQPAAKAMDAARMLLAEFEPVGERWKTDFGFPAAAAVGLHAGDTVFGMAGPAGGEQYVAFGDTVSIAERLVHRARAGEIVFSAAVAKALRASALADWGAEALPALELARRPALPIFGLLLETRLDFT